MLFRFINIESSTNNDDSEEDEYLRDGNDYGNISRQPEATAADVPPDNVIETAYIDKPEEYESDESTVDLNTTIVSGDEIKPTSSIWEGILGLVEDIDKDTQSVDVSIKKTRFI